MILIYKILNIYIISDTNNLKVCEGYSCLPC